MERTLILTLMGHTIPSRNAVDKQHWSRKSQERKRLTSWISLLYRAQVPPLTGQGQRMVKIISYRKRTLDFDNLAGGAKQLLDAMKHAGLLVDDSPAFALVTYQQQLCGGLKPHTVIEVKDAN